MNLATGDTDYGKYLDVSLLDNQVIPVVDQNGVSSTLSLPEVLAWLGEGKVRSFDQIKSYQLPDVEFFMAQIGVLGLDIGDTNDTISLSTGEWKSRLLQIAPASAWKLIADSAEIPAFMQPGIDPVTFAQKLKKQSDWIRYPDGIGNLIKSKNHTVKNSGFNNVKAWHWIVSLIEAQTMASYGGRGLYGSPRMNGAYSSRLKVGAYVDLTASGKWKSDVSRILKLLPNIYKEYPHFSAKGKKIGVIWADFWDRKSQIATTDLHPLYIDCCRSIRLFKGGDGNVNALTFSSLASRVPFLDLAGNFGDPWSPLQQPVSTKKKPSKTDKTTSLSLKSASIHSVSRILMGSDGVIKSPMQALPKEDANSNAYLSISAVLNGQGETYGFADVVVPIPAGIRPLFASVESSKKIGDISKRMIEIANLAQDVVRVAVYFHSQPNARDSEEIEWKNNKHSETGFRKVSEKFQNDFEAVFFEYLWDAVHIGVDEWKAKIKGIARDAVGYAIQLGASRSQQSFKAEAIAWSTFEGVWHSKFSTEVAKD